MTVDGEPIDARAVDLKITDDHQLGAAERYSAEVERVGERDCVDTGIRSDGDGLAERELTGGVVPVVDIGEGIDDEVEGGVELKSTDVNRAGERAAEETASLIGSETQRVAPRAERGAAGEEGVGLGRPAVGGERCEQGVCVRVRLLTWHRVEHCAGRTSALAIAVGA